MNIILKLLLTGVFYSCTVVSHNPVQTDISAAAGSSNKDIEWIKSRTKSLSAGSWYMLMEYDALPSNPTAPSVGGGTVSTKKSTDTFYYLGGRTRLDLLNNMETNVHEIAHGYFMQNVFKYVSENNLAIDWDNVEGYIYLNPGRSFFISFPKKYLFPSAELAPLIPKNLRTFRFSPYIVGNTATQDYGVIGLLDELHAYYLGSRYSYDMLEAYKEAQGSESDGLFEWVKQSQSTMAAFYEFDFFIRKYLLRMKTTFPKDYTALRSYRPFGEAYGTLRTAYEEIINMYHERIRTEIRNLNSSGKSTAWIENGQIWIKAKGSRTSNGTQLFSEDRDKLLPELRSNRYDEVMKDFRIN